MAVSLYADLGTEKQGFIQVLIEIYWGKKSIIKNPPHQPRDEDGLSLTIWDLFVLVKNRFWLVVVSSGARRAILKLIPFRFNAM